MEPNKKSVEMTIGQMFSKLAKQAETWSDEEKLQFKKAWLEGAERVNEETARLREKRLDEKFLREIGDRSESLTGKPLRLR